MGGGARLEYQKSYFELDAVAHLPFQPKETEAGGSLQAPDHLRLQSKLLTQKKGSEREDKEEKKKKTSLLVFSIQERVQDFHTKLGPFRGVQTFRLYETINFKDLAGFAFLTSGWHCQSGHSTIKCRLQCHKKKMGLLLGSSGAVFNPGTQEAEVRSSLGSRTPGASQIGSVLESKNKRKGHIFICKCVQVHTCCSANVEVRR